MLRTPAPLLFAADGGFAKVRLGNPELHFYQFDPDDDSIVVRRVALRFARSRFLARDEETAEFLQLINIHVEQNRLGDRVMLIDDAVRGAKASGPVVLLDADLEVGGFTDEAGMLRFFLFDAGDRVIAVTSRNSDSTKVQVLPQVEVRLPTAALAGLYRSWHAVAQELRQ